MKKIFIFFLISLSILSCSSDDNGSNNTSGNILGTWNGVSVDLSGSTNVEVQGQNLNVNFVGESYDEDFSITVSENPNIVTSSGTYSLELSAPLLGFNQNVEDLMLLEESEWTRDGNELTLTAQGQSQTATIIELTDTTLVISLEIAQDILGNMVTADAIAVFER